MKKLETLTKIKVTPKIAVLVVILIGVVGLSFFEMSLWSAGLMTNLASQPKSVLIVDSAYFSDWARVAGGGWKFQDSILDTAAQLKEGLIKIDLSGLPLNKNSVTKVTLVFNISRLPYIAADPLSATDIYYSPDDSWSFADTAPGDLRTWPRSAGVIYSFSDSQKGWQKVDLTSQYRMDDNNILTILFDGRGNSISQFITSPGYPLASLRPYLIIEYTGAVLPADLTADDSDIVFEPALPNLNTAAITVRARLRNNGSKNIQNVPVAFYRGNPQAGGKLVSKIKVAIGGPGSSAIASAIISNSAGSSNDIYVAVDPDNIIKEIKEGNNIAKRMLVVSNNFNQFTYGFEGSLDGWVADNDVPAVGQTQRAWNIKTLAPDPKSPDYLGPPFEGNQILDLAMDGTGDDGTIWIAKEFLTDPAQKYKVSVETMALAPTNGDMWAMSVLASIGRAVPEEEAYFTGRIGGSRITSWQKQKYEGIIKPPVYLEMVSPSPIDKLLEGNKIWVALGIGASQEYQIHAYFDSLNVVFEELDKNLPDPPTNLLAIKSPVTGNIAFGWNEYDSSIANFKIFYKETDTSVYQSLAVGYPLVAGATGVFSYEAINGKIIDPQKSYDFYAVGYTAKGLASPSSTIINYQGITTKLW